METTFSVNNVIRALAGDRSVDIGREIEISQELQHKGHRSTGQGIIIPTAALTGDFRIEQNFNDMRSHGGFNIPNGRNFSSVTGAGAIGTHHAGDKFIEALMPHSVAVRAGVTMMTGLTGNVSIPKQDTSATAQWLTLDGIDTIEESNPTVSNISLQMRSLAALVPVTHQLLKQSNPQAEQMVKNDLLKIIASTLDKALLSGTGKEGQPLGILNTVGINTIQLAAPAKKSADPVLPTYQQILDMFGLVAAANADQGNMAYIANALLASKLMGQFVADGTGMPIWNSTGKNEGTVAGHRALYSSSVPNMIFGNWADVIVGTWGSVELAVDPNYKFNQGTVGVRIIHDCDIAVRRPESFTALVTA